MWLDITTRGKVFGMNDTRKRNRVFITMQDFMSCSYFSVVLNSITVVFLLTVGNNILAAEDKQAGVDHIMKPIFQTQPLRESLALLSRPSTVSLSGIPNLAKPQHSISEKPKLFLKPSTDDVSKILSEIKEIEKEIDAALENPIEVDEFLSKIGFDESQESILPAPDTSDSIKTPPILSLPEVPASAPGVYPFRAEFLRTPAEAMRLCDEFLLYVVARKYDKAFQTIRPHFPISDYKHEELHQGTKKRLGLAELRFGRPLDYVFIGADTVGDTVLRYRYLQKFDLETLLWEFTFYRPQSGWLLNALGFEAEAGQVFRQ